MHWYEWFFGGIGVAALSGVALFVRRYLAHGGMFGWRLLDRDLLDRAIGPARQRIRKAKLSIWISGNDCKLVGESCSGDIESALKRGVRVKILCIDPTSDAVAMLPKIDPRFPTPESFISSMESVTKVLRDLAERYPDRFEYRFFPILPAQGFFITDPTDKRGVVKVEMHTAKEWSPIESRPHIILSPRSGAWRQYFINQWENYWALGRVPGAMKQVR